MLRPDDKRRRPRKRAPVPARDERAVTIVVDLQDAGDAIVVKVSVPGVPPEHVHVAVSFDMLTITAERREDAEVREGGYIRKEHRYGRFERSVVLPAEVNAEHATAAFRNGVVSLLLPKLPAAGPEPWPGC